MAHKVLVFSNDHVGSAMAGPGIRSYHFACELARSFDVTLMVPRPTDLQSEAFTIRVAPPEPGSLARWMQGFDTVISQFLPLPLARRLHASEQRVIYDLYIPFVERLGFLDADAGGAEAGLPVRADSLFAAGSRLVQRFALATGNAFLCASERQRDLLLGMLAGLGRLNLDVYRHDPPLRNLVDVVPFGLPAKPPVRSQPVLKGVRPGIAESDRVLLWGGGLWNWLDPLTPIRAVERLSQRRDDVKLVFMGVERPLFVGHGAMARRAVELARSLGLLDRFVFFNTQWVPYEERQAYLLEADLGVSAHFASIETRFAFRTRLLDYFWAGLPTVTTDGDALADVVRDRRLGRVVGERDVAGWEVAIEALLEDSNLRTRLAPAFATVQTEFAWPAVAGPLVRLVQERTPPPVADKCSISRLTLEDVALRFRTSLSLGGPQALVGRQVRKLTGNRTY